MSDTQGSIQQESFADQLQRGLTLVTNPVTLQMGLGVEQDILSSLLGSITGLDKSTDICFMSYVRVKKVITDILFFWDGSWSILTIRPDQYNKQMHLRIKVCSSEKILLKSFNAFLRNAPTVVTWDGFLIKRYLALDNRNKLLIDLKTFFRSKVIQNMLFEHQYFDVEPDEIYAMFYPAQKLIHTYCKLVRTYQAQTVIAKLLETVLVQSIFDYNNRFLLELINYVHDLTGTELKDILRPRVWKWMECWLTQEHRKRNWVMPSKNELFWYKTGYQRTKSSHKGGKYAGGNVIFPHVGIHWNVVEIDFTQLYPTILSKMNLSYETYNCQHESCQQNRLDMNTWICSQQRGMYADLVTPLLAERAKLSKKKFDERIKRNLLKTITTIFCGYMVSDVNAVAFAPLAELLPLLGKNVQLLAKEFIEMTGKKILYGDTDSLFLAGVDDEQLEAILRTLEQHIGIPMHVTKYRFIKFSKMKHYYGVTEHGYLVVKGYRGVSTSAPPLIKESLKAELQKLKQVTYPEELQEVLQELKEKKRALKEQIRRRMVRVQDLAETIELSKFLKYYTSWTAGPQLALQLLESGVREWYEMKTGTPIQYLKTLSEKEVHIPHHYKIEGKRDRVTSLVPVELYRGEKIDWQYYEEQVEKLFDEILM